MSPVQDLRDAGDTATSPEGRTFYVSMSPHRVFPLGSLVSLTDNEGVIRLAQVESHQLMPDGQMQAAGRVLDTLGAKGLNTQGEALLAGGFAPVPAAVRVRTRFTREGGRDVAVPVRQ